MLCHSITATSFNIMLEIGAIWGLGRNCLVPLTRLNILLYNILHRSHLLDLLWRLGSRHILLRLRLLGGHTLECAALPPLVLRSELCDDVIDGF